MSGEPMRALVVYCHPCEEGFIPSALPRAIAGLEAAGAEVRVTDLYRDGFTPELSADEHRSHIEPTVSDEIRPYADDLLWCDTLVLVYPTWWSGQPAMLKGWIDRVWAAGVAWELPAGANRLKPKLRNVRRIVAVTSHGSPKLLNCLQGEAGKRVAFRSIRSMCHRFTRTTWISFYGIDDSTEPDRTAFLDRVETRLAKL